MSPPETAPPEEGPEPPRVDASLAHRVVAGAVAKFLAEALARLVSFGVVLWAARELGPGEFGVYLYGVGVGFVLAQGADLGLQLLIAREVATHGRAAAASIRLALRVKLVLTVIVALGLIPLVAGRPSGARFAVLALGAAALLQSFAEFAAHVFRGHQQLGREVALLTTTRVLVAGGAATVLWVDGGLVPLAATVFAVSSAGGVTALILLRRSGWLTHHPPAPSRAEPTLLAHTRAILREALPLGIGILLSAAYVRVGWVLLSYLSGDEAVAQLGVAQRLAETAQLVPAALLAAVFPAYTRALWSGRPGARRIAPSSALALALLGTIAGGAIWVTADRLVPLLFGPEYTAAVPALRVFAIALPFMFLNYLLTHILIARGSQRLVAWFGAVVLALQISVCWMAIPRFGAVGVAGSTLAAEALLLVCCTVAVRLRYRPDARADTGGRGEVGPEDSGRFAWIGTEGRPS